MFIHYIFFHEQSILKIFLSTTTGIHVINSDVMKVIRTPAETLIL